MDSPIPLSFNSNRTNRQKHTVSLKFDFFKGNFIIRSSLPDFSENCSKYSRHFFYRREEPPLRVRSCLFTRSNPTLEVNFYWQILFCFFFFFKVNSGVQDSHLLKGKVINLVMDCTAAWLGNQIVNLGSCLVFKLEGTETCKLVSHF